MKNKTLIKNEMEAKNLRIGNLITTVEGTKHYGHPLRVEFITDNNCDLDGPLDSINGYYEKEVIGLELTEKWLLDFGFKKVGSNYEKEWLLLHTNIKTGTFDFLLHEPQTGKYKATILNHVHQLQNLFFAITGEELELVHDSSTCG